MPSNEHDQNTRPPTDYRRLRKVNDRRQVWMVVGGLLLGGGLIYLIFGKWALGAGLLCLIPGAGLILFLWGMLAMLERWVSD